MTKIKKVLVWTFVLLCNVCTASAQHLEGVWRLNQEGRKILSLDEGNLMIGFVERKPEMKDAISFFYIEPCSAPDLKFMLCINAIGEYTQSGQTVSVMLEESQAKNFYVEDVSSTNPELCELLKDDSSKRDIQKLIAEQISDDVKPMLEALKKRFDILSHFSIKSLTNMRLGIVLDQQDAVELNFERVYTNDVASKVTRDVEDITKFVADVMPEFPGGNSALIDYLYTAAHYPANYKGNREEVNIRGTLSFTVGKDGRTRNVLLPYRISPKLADEVIRAIQDMPKWTPGMQDGKPVDVRYFVPCIKINP